MIPSDKQRMMEFQHYEQNWIFYQQYLGQYWRAGKSLMENHLTGKSTMLLWENYTFRTGLTERNFDQSTLKRSR